MSTSFFYYLLWITMIIFLFSCLLGDIKKREISNKIVYPFIVAGIFEHWYFQGMFGLWTSLFATLVIFILSLLLINRFPLGGGDWKVYMGVASFTGINGVLIILWISFFIQGMIYIVRFYYGKMNVEVIFLPAIFLASLTFFALQNTTMIINLILKL